MHVLYETPAGYALFKVSDKAKLTTAESIATAFATLDSAKAALKLKAFDRFEDTTSALSAATAICDNVLDKKLEQFLTTAVKDKDKEKGVAVIDSQLGKLIKEKLGIKPLYDATVLELIRGIRGYADELLGSISKEDSAAVRLGLSHSLSRYKLKFSPDKVDTMIVQAISLLDELDKELNTYAMRVREWYGWHFPEMGRIVTDNIQYAKAVQKMQVRSQAKNTDFSDVLPEEIESLLKEAAEVSMGTDIAEEDVANITALCEQVVKISEYRASLYEYLRNRMSAIAPNLTCMVGELVGARLIAHAGSLLNLAKHPASTVQILGAEKALFRALKTKHDTPKYGLIYHASLVGQAAPKLKGKISRMLAAKTALSIRMDALGDSDGVTIGLEGREKVELRLRQLEGGALQSISKAANKKPDQQKYTKPAVTQSYNTGADVAMKVEPTTNGVNGHANGTSDKDAKKAAKKAAKAAKKEVEEAAATTPAPATNGTNGTHDDSSSKSSKKSKRKAEEAVEDSKAEAKKSKSSKKDKKKDKA